MVTNFTPIDVQKFRGENNSVNTVLLLIATLTTFVLVVLLFILIQKKTQKSSQTRELIPRITPTLKILPSLTPTTSLPMKTPTPEASPTGKIDINPTKSATGSSSVLP